MNILLQSALDVKKGFWISARRYAIFLGNMAKRKEQGKRKNPLAVALGRRGGKARVARMKPEQLREAMRKASLARWAREKGKQKPEST